MDHESLRRKVGLANSNLIQRMGIGRKSSAQPARPTPLNRCILRLAPPGAGRAQ